MIFLLKNGGNFITLQLFVGDNGDYAVEIFLYSINLKESTDKVRDVLDPEIYSNTWRECEDTQGFGTFKTTDVNSVFDELKNTVKSIAKLF